MGLVFIRPISFCRNRKGLSNPVVPVGKISVNEDESGGIS